MSFSPEIFAQLAKFDTPTICNAIELFGIRPRSQGYMDGRIQAAFPDLPPMVGLATTASFRSSGPPAQGDAYGSLAEQASRLEALGGPGVVVFQDLDEPPVGATFGEVMCSVYRAFGAVGLISSGGGRDLDQVRALDFPVFAGSTICSHAYAHILHLGLPVHVGGLCLYEGDLLHGDRNGVTTIPAEIADELPGVAGEFVAAERHVLDYVQSGKPVTSRALAEAHAEMTAQLDAIRRRVGR